jgi:Holliday junction resolvase RusA-like endonuclease
MSAIRIELLGPPRGKGRPRFSTRNGFAMAHPDKKTETYEACLRHEASVAMAGRAPLDGPLRLTVQADLPIPASWSGKRQREAAEGLIRPTTRSAADLDNIIKSVDALNKVVWLDDSQIVSIDARKFYSTRPRLVLIVEPAVDQIAAALDGLKAVKRAARENGVMA